MLILYQLCKSIMSINQSINQLHQLCKVAFLNVLVNPFFIDFVIFIFLDFMNLFSYIGKFRKIF